MILKSFYTKPQQNYNTNCDHNPKFQIIQKL